MTRLLAAGERCRCATVVRSAVARIVSPRRIGWLLAVLVTGNSQLLNGQETRPAPAAHSPAGRAELRDAARRSYESAVFGVEMGTRVIDDVYQWSRRWLEQELILAGGDKAKIAALNAHLERMQRLASKEFRQREDAEYYLTEAELRLGELHPNPKFDAAVAARKALQGKWKVVRAERDGTKLERADWESETIDITGRRIEFSSPTLGGGWGLLTLDPIVVPHQLDFYGFNEDFPFGGNGIYRFDGDQLTLCWTTRQNRPKDFSTRKDDDTRLYVLKRRAGDDDRPPVIEKPQRRNPAPR